MTRRKDLAAAAVIVLAALTVVTLRLRSTGTAEAQAQGGGHDHGAAVAVSGELSPVVLGDEDARRIGFGLSEVEHRSLPLSVRAVGTVAYDETRLATVNPKVEGWVEALHVDFTGAPVAAGEPLLEVYSPMLVTAQEELILAARLSREAAAGRATENAAQLLESARRRLAYWDIPDEEVRRIEQSGETTKTLTLRAPTSGVVVEKNVVQGDRIMPGMTVYRIANLSRVWIEADVFEKDLALVAEGQSARVTFEAFPGRSFSGRVTYVYPTVSMRSRTARIRLELPNPELELKPGMYASIDLQVPPAEPSAVVPRSAVIETGERALVFVQGTGGMLHPREVIVGRTSGQLTQILAGVSPGERVVSSAAFLVDAESNLGTMTQAHEGHER
ncbi:MAG TPA: efflux RND transporter periplasmic adaptor subunit [Longimicrobiales bacterium]|nr:efflux RND transporter periplasmic adaptor subunit [Longimicrobiales bacterium]